MTDERIGSWLQTYTGKKFYPFDPREEEVDILDIAHALSQLCRFGGHTKEFYSVAEHCVLVSMCCPSEVKLLGLLHDAAEAYQIISVDQSDSDEFLPRRKILWDRCVIRF